ncbi:hypothetical protein [Streptomyces leeuwenhoekii]|nr:hypothetical protein [Streptomyces leeuwenhoekii]
MSEQQPEQPDCTPQPSQIATEPATVEACQQDYAQAADIRRRLGWTDGQ